MQSRGPRGPRCAPQNSPLGAFLRTGSGTTRPLTKRLSLLVLPLLYSTQPYRDPLYDGAPTRLVVSFLSDIDVADLVPPLLKQYTGRIQSAFSNLQVIEAIDESILDLVEAEIQKRTGEPLTLTRLPQCRPPPPPS